ncbi:MAG: BON domain-containing protein [Planctomyces sp.]|nr:BON domain-containing protein [Planctomyces sp.]
MDHHNSAISEPLPASLRLDVISALRKKGYSHLQTLNVHADRATVIVEGVLPTFHLRQIALECIKRVEGVSRVVDRIEVRGEWV